MIKYQKLPQNILQFLPRAVDYLGVHPKVLFAYLFGSLAKGMPLPLSDVDIAVYLTEDANALEDKIDLYGKITDILETDEIDLVILNSASLPLIANVLKKKKLIVDKVPHIRHIFESLMMRKYFDFSRFYRRYLREVVNA